MNTIKHIEGRVFGHTSSNKAYNKAYRGRHAGKPLTRWVRPFDLRPLRKSHPIIRRIERWADKIRKEVVD